MRVTPATFIAEVTLFPDPRELFGGLLPLVVAGGTSDERFMVGAPGGAVGGAPKRAVAGGTASDDAPFGVLAPGTLAPAIGGDQDKELS